MALSRRYTALSYNPVDDALNFVEDYFGDQLPALQVREVLPSLLEQCEALRAASEANLATPVRTVHHLACTGGTLIAKCIGAMPNTMLLSEVDPLSPLVHARRFSPTDLVGLAKLSSRPAGRDLLLKVFLGGIDALFNELRRTGCHLIIRDHAHSHFSYGPAIEPRPSLREILRPEYRLCSVVTVRDPFDSYLSLQQNGWLHFSPSTLDEYARRYHKFLDHYQDVTIIRYEDFVDATETQMQRLCALLELDYGPSFMEGFSAITLSGDSGRSGATIAPRSRRSHPDSLVREALESEPFKTLVHRLGYEMVRLPVSPPLK